MTRDREREREKYTIRSHVIEREVHYYISRDRERERSTLLDLFMIIDSDLLTIEYELRGNQGLNDLNVVWARRGSM